MIETKLTYIANKKKTRPHWKVTWWNHQWPCSGSKRFIRKDTAEKYITLLMLRGDHV